MNELIAINSFQYSTKVHVSYTLGSFFDDFPATASSLLVLKFYETEVFLDFSLLTLVIIIYGMCLMILCCSCNFLFGWIYVYVENIQLKTS